MSETEKAEAILAKHEADIDKKCMDEVLAILKKYNRDLKTQAAITMVRLPKPSKEA
jgi:hypothetical protein